MSASSRLELRVGMLIVAGLAAMVVLILVSDRFSFDDTYQVTAYLDNASGLNKGSPVTLSGIRIGQIEVVRSISDKRGAVQVVMSINERYLLPSDSRLHVASSGIFGDSFLEFTGSGVITPNQTNLPTDGSAEVVASPGFFEKASDQAVVIMDSLADLLNDRTRGDTRRLIVNAADFAAESTALVRDLRAQTGDLRAVIAGVGDLTKELTATSHGLGERLGKSLDGIDAAVAGIDRRTEALTAHADEISAVAVATLRSFDAAADETAGVLRDNRTEIRDALTSLADVSRRTADVMDGLNQGRGVIGQLLVNQDLARDLNETAINLSLASRMVADHPETLVFGASNQQSIELNARRERLRLRRAFQEGYYRTPPVRIVEPVQVADPGERPMAKPAEPEQR